MLDAALFGRLISALAAAFVVLAAFYPKLRDVSLNQRFKDEHEKDK